MGGAGVRVGQGNEVMLLRPSSCERFQLWQGG